MGCCPPVRVDNPRALASGLSYVQVDKHGITFYTTYISVDLVHHEIFCAKVGKDGINYMLSLNLICKLHFLFDDPCTMEHSSALMNVFTICILEVVLSQTNPIKPPFKKKTFIFYS